MTRDPVRYGTPVPCGTPVPPMTNGTTVQPMTTMTSGTPVPIFVRFLENALINFGTSIPKANSKPLLQQALNLEQVFHPKLFLTLLYCPFLT